MSITNLESIFEPARIAVVGASEKEGSVGGTVLRNLQAGGFDGTLLAINPKHDEVFGVPCHARVGELDEAPDLAVICTPTKTVPNIVDQCGQAGTRGVVVVSAGFAEAGNEGRRLQEALREKASRHDGLRILGPNCLGIICPDRNLNASFAAAMPQPGDIAFISQSGALCTAVLDWALQRGMGFSHFVSIGNMMDVSFADLIDYLGDQAAARGVILYAESITNAREFLSAARAATRRMPVIAYKAGRFTSSAEAASSHTGAMAGADAVYSAAFRRAGIERVFDTEDMFDCALLLSRCRQPCHGRLAIVTNAGGPGVMASDALVAQGGALAELTGDTIQSLDELLPTGWSGGNPVDILGDTGPQRFTDAVRLVLQDSAADAVLVILTPQDMTDPTATGQKLGEFAEETGKPILGAWMGGKAVRAGAQALNERGIATYGSPEAAVRAFMHLTSFTRNLEVLQETPQEIELDFKTDRSGRQRDARKILNGGAETLLESEAKQFLELYQIPTATARLATSADQAITIARDLGYPVVLKVASRAVTHKTDVGGVALNVTDDEAVQRVYERITNAVMRDEPDAEIAGMTVGRQVDSGDGVELILGAHRDPVFGTVLMVGTGGTMTEVLNDSVIELPPLNERLARQMLQRLKSWPLLQGHRGRPEVHLQQLVETLLRLSCLIVEQPAVKELDINPLLVTPEHVSALDAHVELDLEKVDWTVPPFAHLAIRPYPEQFVQSATIEDGVEVLLRPIRPEDEPHWRALLKRCSRETLRDRFSRAFEEPTHQMAVRHCYLDYDRELALVAEHQGVGENDLLGECRLMADPDRHTAEYAALIADDWQGRGLGTKLTERILEIAGKWGLQVVVAETDTDNGAMLNVFRECGFELHTNNGRVQAVKDLLT